MKTALQKNTWFVLLPLWILFFVGSGCQKDELYTGKEFTIAFSADTVQFDTIFTTLSSITKSVTIHNHNNKTIRLDEIVLEGGESSPYRINIDGMSTTATTNIEIRGNDSLYIFVEVTLDPNDAGSPMIAEDAITFRRQQEEKKLRLIAFGQDVHLIDGEVVGNTTWEADKPYLIYNSILVDTNATLRLEPGAQLFFNQESHLFVAGSLIAEGTLEAPIVFSGARLDSDYEDIPGQWKGIWLLAGSSQSRFTHALIKNAIIGMQADSMVGTQPTVTLHNTQLLNMTSTALYARGAKIDATNVVMGNCGQYLAALTLGGEYSFQHCTFANFWRYSTRRHASLWLSNYYLDNNNQIQPRPLEKAYFANCLIHGTKTSEIVLDSTDLAAFHPVFEGTFARVDGSIPQSDIPANFRNVNLQFIDPYENNYQLDTLSPVKDKGLLAPAQQVPFDLLENSRLQDNGPDPGAYERIEAGK